MSTRFKQLKAGLQQVKDRLLKIYAVQLIYRTAEGAGSHDVAHLAAGVAYYAILSIFPLLLGIIAVFGVFLPSVNFQEDLLNFVGASIPGAADILRENIATIIERRGVMGVMSIVLFFWSASALFGSISLAINRAWDIRRFQRHFFIRKASEVGMVLGLGILILLSTAISVLQEVLDLNETDLLIVNAGFRMVAFLLILAVFLFLYKFIPNIRTHWRDIWHGALLAAVLFEIARTLFLFYLENFADYQLIYGTIASIIIFLVWIYYSAFLTILGAEFTFQYGRMRHTVTGGSGAVK